LRIAFDATAIPPNRAGAGIYIYSLIKALAEIDAKNEYFVFAKAEHIQEFGIHQPNFQFLPVRPTSTLRRLLWEQVSLPRQLRRMRIEVLHSPHYTMPLAAPCRTVVTFHDMTFFLMPEVHSRFRRLFFPAMMRWSARRAEKLIAVSESTRQDMIRLLSLDPAKVATILEAAGPIFRVPPLAEVEDLCARQGLTPDRYLLYVGVLEPRKNVPLLLQAYAEIAAQFPDTPLVIAGKKGWMYDAIFQKTVALGLSEKVRFLGYVPEEDLPRLYRGARAFVYPSRYEGFGLPVLEAMQCGVPVITSRVSSMPEVGGDAVVYVDPDDVSGLSQALTRMLTDDALAGDLIAQGLKRAQSFTWERCARETLDVYRACLEG